MKARSKWGILAVVGAGAAAALFRWVYRPVDSREIELRRRSYVNQVGRIVEGLIVELIEVPPEPIEERALRGGSPQGSKTKTSQPSGDGRHRKLVGYSYSISGVSYETAQDVTGLEEHARLDRIAAGQSASVKYDPANPSNSILIADDWSGLH